MIPYGRQDITQADVDAVVEVLRSDFLTQGPMVHRFERVVADHVGAKHGLAMNSAPSALHVACLALGLGPGDWLWSTPITFVASTNCALYCGARVDFVDIDPTTYNLDPAALERKLVQAEKDGCLPKVLVPVHLCGKPCDMAALADLAERYGFEIIEDASHAIGATYHNGSVGNCRYSAITIFSFHPVKIVTTAEGGMAMTNRGDLAEHMELLRSHGITRDPALMQGHVDGGWSYQQLDLGFNYRMTDLQAALGISQMARLDAYVARRNALARRYDALMSDLPLITPRQHEDGLSAYHLYVVRVPHRQGGPSRRAIFDGMRADGIGVNVHYIPVHTQPYYRAMGFDDGDFPEAERYYSEAISLPMYPTMTEAQQDEVVEALRRALAA